ncbi:MAG TPA: phosphoenolpyruvate--protein phosphotransferase [Gemmatimonadota bacterium]|nr:phosphoenolpyruvate--protein phosphotransferase [Gemmatimonadota bacterium]
MSEPDTIHHGLGVSHGVAFGPVYVVVPDTLRVPRRAIEPDAIEPELERLRTALDRTRRDISRVRDALSAAGKPGEAAIFDSHLLILEDEDLLGRARRSVESSRVNAEHAFHAAVLDTLTRLESSEDPYLRERGKDVRDVEHRVIRWLLGEREPAVGDLMQNAILVAHDLPATLTAELDGDRILGFATEVGAAHSHTAILARALEIPAVIGLGPVLQHLRHGEQVILDGREGLLIANPSDETLSDYERIRAKIARKRAEWVSLADAPSVTAEGIRLVFQANIDFPREVEAALTFGCEGIGLYRTEYLFLHSGGEAGEEEQVEVYEGMVERMAGRPVTIRTVDLGGDKLLQGMEPEANPFLGWRAIRYCLDRPEVFRGQLRAILRAGARGPTSILIPMITTVEEADRSLDALAEARRSLEREGVPFADDCPVGTLIETPAAAMLADELARRFDFLSLGTNDLIQYTLAVDRGNRRVAHLFQPFHPAVLRLIGEVVAASRDAGREVTICGEMASNSRAAVLLLGLGVRRFSMVPARIPRVKQVLGRISTGEAGEAAREALEAATAEAAQAVIEERFGDRLRRGATAAAGEELR